MDLTAFQQALDDVTEAVEAIGDPTERASAATEVFSATEVVRNQMVAVATLQWQPPVESAGQ